MKKLVSLAMALCLAVGLAACGAPSSAPASSAAPSSVPSSGAAQPSASIRIAGMKGPTTMGMVKLMKDAEEGAANGDYQVEMYATAQEILPLLVK